MLYLQLACKYRTYTSEPRYTFLRDMVHAQFASKKISFYIYVNVSQKNFEVKKVFGITRFSGKTKESMRKRAETELVSHERRSHRLIINKPTFRYSTPYGENYEIIRSEKKTMNFCEVELYVGFADLELILSRDFNARHFCQFLNEWPGSIFKWRLSQKPLPVLLVYILCLRVHIYLHVHVFFLNI